MTVAFNGHDAVEDALAIAAGIRREGINCLVLDTEDGYIRLGLARKIADALGADYVKMDDVSARFIRSRVKQLVAPAGPRASQAVARMPSARPTATGEPWPSIPSRKG